MKIFVAAAAFIAAASAFSINGQDELIKKFGAKNINFDKNVR